MASFNIFLHIVAALTLAGHFCPPLPTYDGVHLYPYVYLPAQPCSALTILAPNTSTWHRSINIRPTRQYTADQLRAVKPAPLDPSLIPRLRELGIGYHLSSRRSCRGGRRKYKKIPVILSRTFTNPTPIEAEPWTADIVVDKSHDLDRMTRHVTKSNLSRITFSSTSQNINILPRGYLHIATYNAQSLGPDDKRTEVAEFIRDSDLDIVFIQETWFKPKGDEGKVDSLAPLGYSVKSWPRDHRGGGTAVVFRNTLEKYLAFISDFKFDHKTFELVVTTFSFNRQNVNFASIYRTFPSRKNKLSDKMFFEDGEFPAFLDYFNGLNGSSIILGDMNFHFDQPTKTYESKIINLLDDFGYSQSVTEPTHKKGHIIDWIMHRPTENLIRSTNVSNILVSDHNCVVVEINASSPPESSKFIETRKIRSMDREAFGRDLSTISPENCQSVEALDSALVACLDKHAPLVQKGIRTKRDDPWYPNIKEQLVDAKQKRRRAERAWLKSGKLTVLRQIFNAAKRYVVYLVQNARKMYLCNQISGCGSTKELFTITNKLTGKDKSSPLPTSHPISQLPDVFCNFFLEKNS